MKKFFENPVMDITKFDTENVITASGGENGTEYTGSIESLNGSYAVKTIDAAAVVDFTF